MKNILSFQPDTLLTGAEIKAWILFHLNHQTSHSKQAHYMQKFLTVKDEKQYLIYHGNPHEKSKFPPIVINPGTVVGNYF